MKRFPELAKIAMCAGVLAALGPASAENDPPFRARTYKPAIGKAASAMPIGKPVEIKAPLGLPPVSIPPDNPPTAETIALGRKLFFDKRLSRDGTVACSSCHDPKYAMADPNRYSSGVDEQKGGRNALAVYNAAYNFSQFWDGRALTLEHQARGPVQNEIEMAHSLAGVERRLAADPKYVAMFAKAFGPGRITFDMVEKSIATYERTLLSGNSPFDRYYYGGDKKALNASAIRGLNLFLDLTLDGPNCVSCHRIEKTHATFTEVRFHNTGVAFVPASGSFTDFGRAKISGEQKDRGAFKVPTLRNIALTSPYMHNGSMKTLEETVQFYFDGGRPNPQLSGVVPHAGVHNIPHDKQPQAKMDLVEFMKALTGDVPALASPPAE